MGEPEVTESEKVLVIDYGGQYTHLISRRCRELGVYAEIIPQETSLDDILLSGVKGAILSGGPRTVTKCDIGTIFTDNLEKFRARNIKVLGICFGHQLLAVHFGGTLAPGGNPEYGQTSVEVVDSSILVGGLQTKQQVWMSHSDEVSKLPIEMTALVISGEGKIAAFASSDKTIFGVQFHPEVTHTQNGLAILQAFLRDICEFRNKWKPIDQIEKIIEYVKDTVGESQVLMGTSGGVDSTVAAYLIRQAIGKRLYCVFVDNGLLREGEREEVVTAFNEMGFEHFVAVDASDEFVDALDGKDEPEEKRKIIANKFIEVFERTAKELEDEFGTFEFLGQGTIYPDRVESAVTGKATAVIKSHHNVRLPDWMKLKLVEPLGDLYKDEVRVVGHSINIPKHMITRQPFPGPSLAIRISGPVTREQLSILRHADSILQDVIEKEPFYPDIWQSFCVLLPVRTVGVMGDERTYDQAIVIRMVESLDAMTASVSTPPWETILLAASRIANEVKGVNRVVYDLTSKPPGTIEWY
ncbi:glutamine-hydrolyzing GMP synthase [Candidatus Thorarchaeota archaeon]|nr:MAG: glutamine-hydrolyzing GMP synthase [Candidatus Thorarchaeota archaeon]